MYKCTPWKGCVGIRARAINGLLVQLVIPTLTKCPSVLPTGNSQFCNLLSTSVKKKQCNQEHLFPNSPASELSALQQPARFGFPLANNHNETVRNHKRDVPTNLKQ